MRARWVKARLAPSPTTRARTDDPSTRISALARSSISPSGSVLARTNVPIPPVNSRPTGACRMARMTSGALSSALSTRSAARASSLRTIRFSSLDHTPPPALSTERS